MKYITDSELKDKVNGFIDQPVDSLSCYTELHFSNDVIKLPIETSDDEVIEVELSPGLSEAVTRGAQ